MWTELVGEEEDLYGRQQLALCDVRMLYSHDSVCSIAPSCLYIAYVFLEVSSIVFDCTIVSVVFGREHDVTTTHDPPFDAL